MIIQPLIDDLTSWFEQAASDIVALMEELIDNTRMNLIAALVAAVMSVPFFIIALFYLGWVYL